MDNKISLYFNTIKYLKISQIYYRILKSIKRKFHTRNLFEKKNIEMNVNQTLDLLIPELDWNSDYLDRFDFESISNNKFTFINITNTVDLTCAWNNKELQHLWRYNLHYFEYLFKLSYEYSIDNNQIQYYEKFKYFVDNWIDNNPFAIGDGWHPYTISLRLTNWISIYKPFSDRIMEDYDFNKKFKESIYIQYLYLQKNLEKDVLGNHYFENIKAIIIGSIFFTEKKITEKFKKKLLKQIYEQILDDGMHFELSLMYHKIILEDLIKITYWLKDETIYSDLISYIQKMIDVIYSFEEGFGKTPAFNDSAEDISKEYKNLLSVCDKYFGLVPQHKDCFESSGFYIIKNENNKLIFDTGDICPSYLPAHGHCDALSFELSINNIPLIVNSGTYKYESGDWRNYFRSTKSHNTVAISNYEQSQFWSSFRVAKRIKNLKRKKFTYKGIQFYAGSYISYHGEEHKRYIGNIEGNKILILDYVKSSIEDKVKSYLHFVPGTYLNINEKITEVSFCENNIKVISLGAKKISIEQGWYSNKFNIKEKNSILINKKNKSKNYFGYLIDLDYKVQEITELNNELRIVGDTEVIINYDELGDML